ncbi:MAG: 2-amino-4-hydroxy-6-hydroxymethyldihydropteridine diphosphokinase [Deltaproteobacteria bacterium]|nr:2-amino-4-hydroxy-6-hydroxymethyldihydropteridine diphosphokinase [Deltaproteobacteria bacterium]
MKGHIAYISVGSNIGNKIENCKKGVDALIRSDSVTLKAQSRYYKTDPVDYLNQDWFINYVVKIETSLDPFELLNRLKSIQRNAGRINDVIRFGPRILDLDIILFGDVVINLENLTIPHPRMHKRRFVLKPVCDIDAEIIHPVFKKNMEYLLNNIDDEEQGIAEYKCDY